MGAESAPSHAHRVLGDTARTDEGEFVEFRFDVWSGVGRYRSSMSADLRLLAERRPASGSLAARYDFQCLSLGVEPTMSDYLSARAANCCRLLRAIESVGDSLDGADSWTKLVAGAALHRGVLEDAAMIVWLVDGGSSAAGMIRFLRVIKRDAELAAEHDLLLALTRASHDVVSDEFVAAREAYWSSVRETASAGVRRAAAEIEADPSEMSRRVQVSEVIRGAFPDERSMAVWRVLSQLSHFSYAVGVDEVGFTMRRDLLAEEVATTVARAVRSASDSLGRALRTE